MIDTNIERDKTYIDDSADLRHSSLNTLALSSLVLSNNPKMFSQNLVYNEILPGGGGMTPIEYNGVSLSNISMIMIQINSEFMNNPNKKILFDIQEVEAPNENHSNTLSARISKIKGEEAEAKGLLGLPRPNMFMGSENFYNNKSLNLIDVKGNDLNKVLTDSKNNSTVPVLVEITFSKVYGVDVGDKIVIDYDKNSTNNTALELEIVGVYEAYVSLG
jgi:hypothetical protein